MKIYAFSSNEEVLKHFVDDLSTSNYFVCGYSTLIDLYKGIEQETPFQLIFHLGNNEQDEKDLEAFQQQYNGITNTLVVTNTPNSEQGLRVLNLNVRGYANTFIDTDKLKTALSVIAQGEVWAGAALIQYMLSRAQGQNTPTQTNDKQPDYHPGVFQKLTTRELQIAQKILSGLQNKLIADELCITERTVKAHLSAIYKKLGIRNRLELTLKLQQADRRSERVERRKTL